MFLSYRPSLQAQGQQISGACCMCHSQVAEDQSQQARVAYLVEGGPAARAGLAVGDRVLSLNGASVDFGNRSCAAPSVACTA